MQEDGSIIPYLIILGIAIFIASIWDHIKNEKQKEEKQRIEDMLKNEERMRIDKKKMLMDVIGELHDSWPSFALESVAEIRSNEVKVSEFVTFIGPALSTGFGNVAYFGFVAVSDDYIYYFSLRENEFPNVRFSKIEDFDKYSSVKTLEDAEELMSKARNQAWKHTRMRLSDDVSFNYTEKVTEVSHNIIFGSGDLSADTRENHIGVSVGNASFGTSSGSISGKLSSTSVGSEFSEKIVEYVKISVSGVCDGFEMTASFEIRIPFWDLSRPEIRDIVGSSLKWNACQLVRKEIDQNIDDIRAGANRLSEIISRSRKSYLKYDDGQRDCPFCGEVILAKALKCKHCHSMLNQII